MRAYPIRTAVLGAFAWLVAFLVLAPYLYMLVTSLKPRSEVFAGEQGYLPEDWSWANFVEVWERIPLADYLRNTLVIAGLSTLLAVAVALPAAYYTARRRFRGRRAFLLLVLVTQMFAPTALVIGIFREMKILGLTDTYLALILTNAGFNLAFSIWILHAYFSSIPVELEEAAMLDGCGRWRALTKVTLPLAVPGVITAVIFTFIAAWNEFIVALTLTTDSDTQPLTVGITSFIGEYQVQWQYLFAASLVAVVPVVVLFAFIERYLVSGLTAGSIKG